MSLLLSSLQVSTQCLIDFAFSLPACLYIYVPIFTWYPRNASYVYQNMAVLTMICLLFME